MLNYNDLEKSKKGLEANKNSTTTKMLPISCLRVDTYQRDWDPQKSKEIAAEFDIEAVGIIPVSYRDGVHYVIDGWHRTKAMESLGIENIKCEIRTGLTKEQEANLFYKINFIKKCQKPSDKINSLLEGKDSLITDLVQATNDEGYTIRLRSENIKKDGLININAIETLKRCYVRLGDKKYRKMLRIIRKTWGSDTKAVSSAMISAVKAFINVYDDIADYEVFSEKLSTCNPINIEKHGKAQRTKLESIEVCMVRMFVKQYNKRLRKGLLPDRLYREFN